MVVFVPFLLVSRAVSDAIQPRRQTSATTKCTAAASISCLFVFVVFMPSPSSGGVVVRANAPYWRCDPLGVVLSLPRSSFRPRYVQATEVPLAETCEERHPETAAVAADSKLVARGHAAPAGTRQLDGRWTGRYTAS